MQEFLALTLNCIDVLKNHDLFAAQFFVEDERSMLILSVNAPYNKTSIKPIHSS